MEKQVGADFSTDLEQQDEALRAADESLRVAGKTESLEKRRRYFWRSGLSNEEIERRGIFLPIEQHFNKIQKDVAAAKNDRQDSVIHSNRRPNQPTLTYAPLLDGQY